MVRSYWFYHVWRLNVFVFLNDEVWKTALLINNGLGMSRSIIIWGCTTQYIGIIYPLWPSPTTSRMKPCIWRRMFLLQGMCLYIQANACNRFFCLMFQSTFNTHIILNQPAFINPHISWIAKRPRYQPHKSQKRCKRWKICGKHLWSTILEVCFYLFGGLL